MGRITIEFAKKNNFGVLDHDVTLPSGEKVYNPMRVCANDKGSEVLFTLYRRPRMSDEEFTKDARTVKRDLRKLKELLERSD